MSSLAMDILSTVRSQTKSLLVINLMLVSLFILWPISSLASDPEKDDLVDASEAVGSEILDGMTFIGELGLKGRPADVKDTFVFEDGNFVSKECEKTCRFPARPYFIRHVGDTIEFISETRCPDKDAKIVWQGIVDGETIKGMFHWTSKRWYWTIEKDFWFEGTLIENTPPTIGSQ